MNYLAHAFLSFDQPELLVGNMIADFVKGRNLDGYSAGIQRGIRLHRAIDRFTDTHEATRMARTFFRENCGRYGAVFVDVIYDHFLGNDPHYFQPETLQKFAVHAYELLEEYEESLPEPFREAFYHMRLHNWLYGYQQRAGVSRAFEGICRRARYMPAKADAYRVFEKNYESLSVCYDTFMPAVRTFAWENL